ncbi:MAG: hypothetical protein ACLP7Q_23580 [Isosphaeraceae bacterium]
MSLVSSVIIVLHGNLIPDLNSLAFNALKKAVDLGLRLGWTCTGGLCGSGETAMATPTEMEMPTEQEVTLRGKLFFLRAAIETAKRQIRVDAELLARQAVFLIAAGPIIPLVLDEDSRALCLECGCTSA